MSLPIGSQFTEQLSPHVGRRASITLNKVIRVMLLLAVFGVAGWWAMAPAKRAAHAADDLQASPIAAVSAANFEAPITAESIVSVFGANLATRIVSGTTTPLPTSLDGTT
ncbi:MAG: hypothetical protein HOP19_26035, partial [Acidobacteria bacterium]|nr:hypothetical protein [Acidobacteriota bacterium]